MFWQNLLFLGFSWNFAETVPALEDVCSSTQVVHWIRNQKSKSKADTSQSLSGICDVPDFDKRIYSLAHRWFPIQTGNGWIDQVIAQLTQSRKNQSSLYGQHFCNFSRKLSDSTRSVRKNLCHRQTVSYWKYKHEIFHLLLHSWQRRSFLELGWTFSYKSLDDERSVFKMLICWTWGLAFCHKRRL